jgi:hypothetical protein
LYFSPQTLQTMSSHSSVATHKTCNFLTPQETLNKQKQGSRASVPLNMLLPLK